MNDTQNTNDSNAVGHPAPVGDCPAAPTPSGAASSSVVAAFGFDAMDTKMRVEVRDEEGLTALVICGGDCEHRVLRAYPDQWGTWITVSDKVTIPQEDCTRSFVEALICGLNAFKKRTDYNTLPPATLNTEDQTQPT